MRKGILLTQHGEAGVVANWVPSSPHIPLLGLATLPSPSSWESPASVGHSTLAAGTIPFLCSQFPIPKPPCSCSFLPLASLPPFYPNPPEHIPLFPKSTSQPPHHRHICFLEPPHVGIRQVQTMKAPSQQALARLPPFPGPLTPTTLIRRDAAG